MRFSIYTAILLFTGCSQENDFKPVYDVPEELRPIVDTFVREAAHRGVTVSITNLIINFSEDPGQAVCGSCNSASLMAPVQKVVTINSGMPCWTEPQELENLIFHELGHCILGRSHTDSRLPNGEPRSLMVENNISLYSPCVYQIGDEPCNNLFKREYYLDELFDENTPVPPWGE